MIELRDIGEEHIEHVQLHASHPAIGKTSNVPFPYPQNGAELWLARVRGNEGKGISKVFAIEKEQRFVGVISLNKINLENQSADIDYWVAVEHHGNGFATEAVSKTIKYAQNTLGIKSFVSGCLESNIGSRKVLEKNKFSIVSITTMPHGKFEGRKFLNLAR